MRSDAEKRSARRLREIVRVLGAYGFGHVINTKFRVEKRKKDPENLRLVFEELGPTFIKIGQILSTRPDILPQAYIVELSKLQDSAPSFSFEQVRGLVEEDLSREIFDIFESFDKDPVASASVAQVHNAVLKGGTPVIVKVQRPDIEDRIIEDLDILIKIVRRAPNTLRDVLLDPLEALQEIRETTIIELDFRNEVAFMERFRKENRDISCISVPKVYHLLSTKRIVVQERIDGIKITHAKELFREGYDPEDIGKKLTLSYLYQIFNNGFFHGDPHPGNLLVSGRRIFFIDFGIMGELSERSKKSFNDLLGALVRRDIPEIVNLVISIGVHKGQVSRNRLYEDVDDIIRSYFQSSLRNIQISMLFMDLFDAARKNNLKLPKEFTTLLKSMLILEGVLADLAPDLSIMDIAGAYIRENAVIDVIPNLDFDSLRVKGFNLVMDTLSIPSSLSSILDSFASGRGKVKVDLVNMNEKWVDFNKMVNRMVFALIVAAIIIASALIIRVGSDSAIGGVSLVGFLGFLLAGFLGLWLLLSILKSGNI
jgi:ubiquinone biosynthesis protein